MKWDTSDRTSSVRPALALACLLASQSCAIAQWGGPTSRPHHQVAISQTQNVPGCSGILSSRISDTIFWVHDDSGPPRVHALRLDAEDRNHRSGRDMGWVELTGARNVNWEDIAAGPDGMIYLLDGGDNSPCIRTDKRILRFREPCIDPTAAPVHLESAHASIRFEYPDSKDPARPATRNEDRYDAECMIVQPRGGDIFVVTKRDNRGSAAARVYRLSAADAAWGSPKVHVLKLITDISDRVPHMVTGGDVDRTGRYVVIRNYLAAYEFMLPEGKAFEEVFSQKPRKTSLFGELQGEGICYNATGNELITTSEVQMFGLRQFPIYAAELRAPAPATATAPQ